MNDLNNIYEYRYMDEQVKKIRESSLKDYLINQNTDMLKFADLDIFVKPTLFYDEMLCEIYKSKLDPSIVLNKYQIEILNILNKHNLFLSAPTSFGKTFVMLEYIKRNIGKLNNIIFIIPTIALMNELLKKIYNYFSEDYNICTNGGEVIESKNIFIFVPERSDVSFFLKIVDIKIDLLVFDEIYKLEPKDSTELKRDDRIIYMNKVYLDLVNKANKIALLGPFINSVKFEHTQLDIVKYYTNYMPVYNELIVLNKEQNWSDFIKSDRQQLIYFKSPESIYEHIQIIIDKVPVDEAIVVRYKEELDYLEESVGKEWYVVELLKRGIGIHHGKTPMFLRKFYENEYNNGNIRIILCTNTLMEGINTPTDSLIVVDDPGSAFKLNNLIGRVGRLNIEHPNIGEAIIASTDILGNITNMNDWYNLNILAENPEATIDDEIIYLDKNYADDTKKAEMASKIKYLNDNFNVTTEMIVERNLEFLKVYKMFNDNIYAKYCTDEKIIDFVNTSLQIIPGPAYAFKIDKFKDLNSDYNYLPYKYYLTELLYKKSMKEIVNDFNIKFNINHNISNINIFIDSLYVLNNFIKFKFSKIINYIEIIDIDKNSKINKFIGLTSNFQSLETSYKILDDLGIAENDSSQIIEFLNVSNVVSSSTMMRLIRQNKDNLIKQKLNPFTINNIKNM